MSANKKDLTLSELEEKTLEFWQSKGIFQKSLDQTKTGEPFVFFEGPPTANGKPGLHHIIARSFKDIICRYQTMRGRYVARQAGWDTHGLPVEIQVEKELGLKSKSDIENLVPSDKRASIKLFNQKCKESVWQYKDLWENLTARMGYWLDMDNPYVTYNNDYIESLWSIISEVNKKKLLYQGYKILPWCPRCGTGLSSHEVAQGYEVVKDTSVYIKFKLSPDQKIGQTKIKSNTYITSWTTTPWTLPGNVALAVGSKIKYVTIKEKSGDTLIIAQSLADLIDGKVIQEFSGTDLVGLKYEPLFKVPKLKSKTAYQVYPADFVTTEDGTGVVHTAVMYGVDDYELGLKHDLPAIHTVDATGHFQDFVPIVKSLYVKDKTTEDKIISYLTKNNNLIKTLAYKHEYPFCWRCHTPIIYYARSSWFIKMSALKQNLLKRNKTINWIPDHLKDGRFGEWLDGVKDWAFSRERYWATPIPVWKCSECDHLEVVSSFDDLSTKAITNKNNFFIIRHGEAVSNKTKRLSSYPEKFSNPLTPKGIKEVLKATKSLAKNKIDLIIASDLERTKQTTEIIKKELGLKKVIYDKRLRELDFKKFNGRPLAEEAKNFDKLEDISSLIKRTISALLAIDQKYQDKNILIVSHGANIKALKAFASGQALTTYHTHPLPKNAIPESLPIKTLPRDDEFNVDPHRPFIDEIHLTCPKCQQSMDRIPELADAWFDSGAMPFAAPHFLFGDSKKLTHYPAEYICEAVDQTRGWFYTLLAIATLLDKPAPYQNVISLGHINDKHGKKMSKSLGNIIDPWEMMSKYSADAVRWHLFTINSPGESKNFDEHDLKKINLNVFNILKNSLIFWQTYASASPPAGELKTKTVSKNVLDQWIISRLHQTTQDVTAKVDQYDIYRSAKAIEELINDISRWYIRRSRPRFQNPVSKSDLVSASTTLHYVLLELSKLIAPFAPFFAEYLYQELNSTWSNKNKKESIHLESWTTKTNKTNSEFIDNMATVRELASLALASRSSLGIKVRQPLAELKINNKHKLPVNLLKILADEVNVKKITTTKLKSNLEIELETKLTPILKEEGLLRELIRAIQSLRADAGLNPGEPTTLYLIKSSSELNSLIKKYKDTLKSTTSLKDIKESSPTDKSAKSKTQKDITIPNLDQFTLAL